MKKPVGQKEIDLIIAKEVLIQLPKKTITNIYGVSQGDNTNNFTE